MWKFDLFIPTRPKAKKSKKTKSSYGNPYSGKFKAMVHIDLIKNNQVTTKDVKLATKAFGDDFGELKGKMTRSKSMPVTSNKIETPNKLIEVQWDMTQLMDSC
jgi:hypothetical protein